MTLEATLPHTKTMLSFLGLHITEREKCVELGMRFLQTGKQLLHCWENNEWEEKIHNLEKQIEKQKKEKNDLIALHTNEKQHLSMAIRSTEQARYSSEITELRDKKTELERKLTDHLEKYYGLHKQLTEEFEKKQNIREKKYEEKIQVLEEKIEKLHKASDDLVLRTQKSTYLGQDGEKLTCQALNCLFPKAEITDTHALGGRGDFILKEGDISCLIETKNHKSNVGRVDIDKFYNDIETNDDIKCGIFASLKSGVVNRDDFHLEFRNKKPILFLTHVKDNLKNLELALLLFRVLLGIKDLEISQKEVADRIKHIVPVIKRRWTTLRTTITTFQTTMFQLISQQEESLKALLGGGGHILQ